MSGISQSGSFRVGDHVGWDSEAGWVCGRIIAAYEKNFLVNGYIHHASLEDPQYAIRSDKSSHVAYHKGSALRHMWEGPGR